MARRRGQASGRSGKFGLVLVAGLLAAGAWWYWQQRTQASSTSDAGPVAAAGNGSQEIVLPPPQVPADGLCTRLGDLRVATLLATNSVTVSSLAADSAVPRVAGCSWRTAEGGEVIAMWFDDASLARGQVSERGAAYFQSVVTGLEYALKATPEKLTGVGDEAAAAGFGTTSAAQGQVVARRGGNVLTLEARGIPRAAAVRMTEALVAQL